MAAIPETNHSRAYERLRRVWFDPTRFHGKRGTPDRYHEFVKLQNETHLTVSLWENFALFAPRLWVPKLMSLAGLRAISIERAEWSYEWVSKNAGERMCDVVIEYRKPGNEPGVLIVEAKALGKKLGEKDKDPGYYLDLPELAGYGSRSLVYLVDQKILPEVLGQLGTLPPGVGVLSWQMLGGLQVELATKLDVPPQIRNWIAGGIQFQFAQHNIRPTLLSAPYLRDEPSISDIDNLPREARQTMAVHYQPLWKIGELSGES